MSKAVYDYNSIDWNSLFEYDPSVQTGLRWKVDRWCGRWGKILAAKAGTPAGNIHEDKKRKTRYANVPSSGVNWKAHRVIWIMHNGHLSEDHVIDHIDGNTLNNSIGNLRAVKQVLNNRNASLRKDNSSGLSGVHITTARSTKPGKVFTYFTSTWYEEQNGKLKRFSKHFSVEKLGLLPAQSEACEYRKSKIDQLNSKGYNYSSNHGT